MKRHFIGTAMFSLLLVIACAMGGCANPLPKPVNANGSISPTVTVGDADLTYQDAAGYAATYIATCRAAPTTPGCSPSLSTNLKAASKKANKALHAAHEALKNLPAGATGIDAAIGDLQAALAFLQSFTNQIPASLKGQP